MITITILLLIPLLIPGVTILITIVSGSPRWIVDWLKWTWTWIKFCVLVIGIYIISSVLDFIFDIDF